MTDTTSQAPAPLPTAGPSRRARLAIAAAAVVLAGIAGAVALSRDDEPANPDAGDVANGPITPGGPSLGSCVEVYDLQTIANRELAFDGTVTAVEGDTVTFDVNEWYRGDGADTATLAGAGGLGGLTSAGEAVPLAPGTRLLVAGDGGFAWSCGFTQPYDAAVADQWRDALAP